MKPRFRFSFIYVFGVFKVSLYRFYSFFSPAHQASFEKSSIQEELARIDSKFLLFKVNPFEKRDKMNLTATLKKLPSSTLFCKCMCSFEPNLLAGQPDI